MVKYARIDNDFVAEIFDVEPTLTPELMQQIEQVEDTVQAGMVRDAQGVFAFAPQNLPEILKQHRKTRQLGGVTFGGVTVETDLETRNSLVGARIQADADASYTVEWKTPNGFVTLNAVQIVAITNAVADHIQKCFSTESTVLLEVESGTLTTGAAVTARFDEVFDAS